LGISIAGGLNTGFGAVFVAKVFPNTPASECGSIREGDRLLCVQKLPTMLMTQADVVSTLKNLKAGSVELELMRIGDAQWKSLQSEAGVKELNIAQQAVSPVKEPLKRSESLNPKSPSRNDALSAILRFQQRPKATLGRSMSLGNADRPTLATSTRQLSSSSQSTKSDQQENISVSPQSVTPLSPSSGLTALASSRLSESLPPRVESSKSARMPHRKLPEPIKKSDHPVSLPIAPEINDVHLTKTNRSQSARVARGSAPADPRSFLPEVSNGTRALPRRPVAHADAAAPRPLRKLPAPPQKA
jgi:hypothetical protein